MKCYSKDTKSYTKCKRQKRCVYRFYLHPLNRLWATFAVSYPNHRAERMCRVSSFPVSQKFWRVEILTSRFPKRIACYILVYLFFSQEPAGQDRYRNTEIPRCTMHKVQFSSLPHARSKMYSLAYSRTTCVLQRKVSTAIFS